VSDTVDIYDDRGKLLESNVDIMNLAPTRNAAIKKIILDTKRSVAVSLAGIQGALASGKMGGKGRQILGRGLNYDIVGNVDAIAENVKKLVQVDEGDDTNVKVVEVAMDMIAHGWSPEEIHFQHPNLSLAQIHAALAHYHDHQAEFDRAIQRKLADIDALAADSRETPLRQRLKATGRRP